MSNQEVLLIGGMGFVGRRLQEPLLKAGYRVNIIDRKSPQKGDNSDIVHHECSLADEAVLKRILKNCHAVFYLASDSVPATTVRNPSREGDVNLMPFLKFLDTFQDCSRSHMVYLSSGGTIYGNPQTSPIDESGPIAPISYHGAGKAAMEAFLHAAANQTDNRITVLRPSNLYGPGQPCVSGFGIIRNIMERIREDQAVEIWGEGEIVRDYLYIDDFVSACLACVARKDQKENFRVFNVSSGQSISINDLCGFIEAATGREFKKTYLPGRRIDVRSVVLDNNRLKRELGWRPVVEIEEGLKHTWQWIQTLSA